MGGRDEGWGARAFVLYDYIPVSWARLQLGEGRGEKQRHGHSRSSLL